MIAKDTFFSKKPNINIRGKLFDLSEPVAMGVINITPDSFYSGSRFLEEEALLKRISQILSEGGKIVDIGAYSSRPQAEEVNELEEKKRLKWALQSIRKNFPEVIISIDSFRSSIVEWAAGEFGVDIINDISGGTLDPKMFSLVACLNKPYILMHMRGTSATMQQFANYTNITKEVISELSVKVLKLRELGVNDIIIDPGFGFAKTIDQNFELLRNLDMLKIFELPVLVGLSRKSMIYKNLSISPEEALNGTTVLNTIALMNGANILRVHDIKEACETIQMVSKLKG